MYEDEFELTFDTPEEEPVYEPEKASAAPAPVPETTPAEIVPDEPTRVLEPRSAAPAEPAEPTPVSEPEPAEEPQPQSAAVPANGCTVLISGGDRGIGAAAARAFYAAGYRVAVLYHSNAEWQHMLDVNLTGAFHLCQLALPGMIRRKAGRILTVSSMWGQTGGSCEVHYSAAKAGLIGLTKALAKEEGPSGITVNCVAPGVIETDMMAAFTAEDKAALAEETPVGRLGTADEVAKLLVFLAGEDAGYITGQVFGVNGGLVI